MVLERAMKKDSIAHKSELEREAGLRKEKESDLDFFQ